ncbi:MAG: SRPBCC family protein [Chloroflexi bacterium]|nr:SRPBCC family protein [Chloroflexota bacterium]
MKYVAEIGSKHGPEQVFDYLPRFSNAEQWDPSIVRGAMLTSEPVQAGSRFDLVANIAGREVDLEYEVVEYDRPGRFKVTADGGSFVSEDTITVTPVGMGATVRYEATLSFAGLGKILAPIWWLVFRRIGAKAATGLGDWLNREALDPPSRVE